MTTTQDARTTWRERARAVRWWALALCVLLAGYTDLAVGGTTLSAILLAAAYVALIPLAVLDG